MTMSPIQPFPNSFGCSRINPSGAFQLLTFDVTEDPGFPTFVLPSTWTDIARVRFSGRLFAQDGSPRVGPSR